MNTDITAHQGHRVELEAPTTTRYQVTGWAPSKSGRLAALDSDLPEIATSRDNSVWASVYCRDCDLFLTGWTEDRQA